jgi:hypothetical protein
MKDIDLGGEEKLFFFEVFKSDFKLNPQDILCLKNVKFLIFC